MLNGIYNLPKRELKSKRQCSLAKFSVNHERSTFVIDLFDAFTIILFHFCAKYARVGIVQNGVTLPL